jgi:hypothetical protein
MTDDPQLGFAGMGLEPTPEAHARNVMLGSGPWQATDLQRELLRILLYHSGAQRAISLHALIVKLERVSSSSVNLITPIPTEREIKDAIRSLVVDFKVRIGASRSKPFGYFFVTTPQEARDAAHPYISEMRELAKRVRVLLDPHDLGELAGQQWITNLLAESDPVPPPTPKEAA